MSNKRIFLLSFIALTLCAHPTIGQTTFLATLAESFVIKARPLTTSRLPLVLSEIERKPTSFGFGRRVDDGLLPSQSSYGRRYFSSQTDGTPSSPLNPGQLYGIATYDALFKWVLSSQDVLPSFLKVFIPDLNIVSAERIDDHMHPVKSLQLVRDFVNGKETLEAAEDLVRSEDLHVVFTPNNAKDRVKHENGTNFLKGFLTHFNDIKRSFPPQEYDGTMDFVCRLDDGNYAMVEMQVAPQDYWDYRALAYAAHLYGGQLYQGGSWAKNLKRVVAINILGGGKDDNTHWHKTPDQFVRHYKIQEQLHEPARFINGIELIQYSIMNAPKDGLTQEKNDWITFFKRGHNMTREEVEREIKTEAVLKAFQLSQIKDLPAKVREEYEKEDRGYSRYSQHTDGLVQEGREEEKKQIALEMLKDSTPHETIMRYTGLSEEEILELSKKD